MSENRVGNKNHCWSGGTCKRICSVCGSEFETYPSSIKKGWGKYCSRKCMGIWRSKNLIGEKSPLWKRIKATCPICNNEYYVMPCYAKKKRGKYCSKKCYGQWRSTTIRREKHPNWKGDNCIAPIAKRIKWSDKYKDWRSKIFIRDDFTCQDCGVRGGELHPHHKDKTFSFDLTHSQLHSGHCSFISFPA